ncbi:MAG: MFS transporter [Oscillospiraceae bacterium]|jgi:Na+/melibiose symporter-like transporter|nr:MFS transporter [Oscillospiraceae bacterium]
MSKAVKHAKTAVGQVPGRERRSYYLGALGQGMLYACMSSYISDFYLNVMLLTSGFVMALTLVSRIWDAVNDPIMGVLMDKIKPKKGGAMVPYLFYSPVPIALLTLLLFIVPGISPEMKMIYAAVTYVAWDFFYTIGDIPFWALPNAMTPDPAERARIISISRTTNGIGSAIPMALFMGLGFVLPKFGLEGVGLEKVKYLVIAGIACAVGGSLFYRTAFRVKERVPMRSAGQEAGDAGAPNPIGLVFRCKPLMLTVLMGILASGRYLFQAGAVHVARYAFYIGKDTAGLSGQALEDALQSSISTVSTVMMAVAAVGMFGSMVLIPTLIQRFSYKQLIMVSALVGSAACFGMYFAGYQRFWLCVPLLLVACFPLGVINVVSFAMVADALDYMEWSSGYRQTGLGQACQTFVSKLSNALATAVITLTYTLIGLDPKTLSAGGTVNPANLDPGMRGGIFSLVSLVPAISLLLCTIPLFFYDLHGEKKNRVTRELAERRGALAPAEEG